MTTIKLAVTVELNDDLTADEISAFTSELIFGISRAGRNETAAAIRNGKNAGLSGTINVKVLD